MKKPSYWTIQILPEGSGRSQSYRVRKRTAQVVVCVIAGVFGLASALALGVMGRSAAVDELERYRAENRQLIASLQSMERRSGMLNQALDDLSVREQRFRVIAGLPLLDPEVYSVGVGGPGGGAPASEAFFEVAPDLAREAGSVTLRSQIVRAPPRRLELLFDSDTR